MGAPVTDTAALARARIDESIDVRHLLRSSDLPEALEGVVDAIVACLRADGAVLFLGNGGSSADAGHLAAELLGRFKVDRAPLRAVALADNTAAMTAIANDYAYDETFERQVRGLGRPGDVVVGLSTSGRSRNVVRAFVAARERGMTTVGFTGEGGGLMAVHADHLHAIPSRDTARIQECHVLLGHTMCEAVEMAMTDPLTTPEPAPTATPEPAPTATNEPLTEPTADALLDLLPRP
jgi:D-sedoheptulose 7-phosphate isomerase